MKHSVKQKFCPMDDHHRGCSLVELSFQTKKEKGSYDIQ